MTNSLVWLGVVLGVLASMSGTAGKQLMRFSELKRRKGTRAALCEANVSIVAGLAINTVVGPLIDMASYAFAPQSVIAPLGGLDVVWNTLTAPCTLGEKLTGQLLIGCGLIAAGASGTSVFGQKEDKEYTPELLRETIFRWQVGAYLAVLGVWLAFNIFFLLPRSAAPKGEPFVTGDKLRGLALGMVAGSIAGNMFCVKAFVEVVQGSIRDDRGDYWADWLPYVLFVGALLFAVSNICFLKKAMCEYEALFMGAVFEGTLIVTACVSGCIVFSDLDGLQIWEVCLYWFSVLWIVIGILAVATGHKRQTIVEDVDVKTTPMQPSEPPPEAVGGSSMH